jgi:hypothetical protein
VRVSTIAAALVWIERATSEALTAFQLRLTRDPLDTIVTEELLSGPVWAFGDQHADKFGLLRDHLHGALGLRPDSVFVVGSAKVGFSLAPDSFARPFDAHSDIDVLVIDADWFDRIWLALVRVRYSERWRRALGVVDEKRVGQLHRDVSFGWVKPTRCTFRDPLFLRSDKTLSDARRAWFDAFQSLGRHKQFRDRSVSGRVYRTTEHAVEYHVDGLAQIRKSLTEATP